MFTSCTCLFSYLIGISFVFWYKFIREEVRLSFYHYGQFITTSIVNRYLLNEMKEFMAADLDMYQEIFKLTNPGKSGFFKIQEKKYVYDSRFHTTFHRDNPRI